MAKTCRFCSLLNMYLTHWNNSCSLLNLAQLIFHKRLDACEKALVWNYNVDKSKLLIWKFNRRMWFVKLTMCKTEGISLCWSCWERNTQSTSVLQSDACYTLQINFDSTDSSLQRAHKPINGHVSFWPVIKLLFELTLTCDHSYYLLPLSL